MPSAENDAVCQRSIRYTPTDGETGRDYPEVHVRCTLPPNHTGFHMGDDRMPFGPWIERVTPPARTAPDTATVRAGLDATRKADQEAVDRRHFGGGSS